VLVASLSTGVMGEAPTHGSEWGPWRSGAGSENGSGNAGSASKSKDGRAHDQKEGELRGDGCEW
jgi:hypothetical protein